MDFITLKKRAAKELNILDSSGNILTGRDITEAKIGEAINDAYLHDVIPLLMHHYPYMFEVTAYASNYSSSASVTIVSGAVVTVGSAIFLLGSEGCNVYNSTKDEYEKIKNYISTTQVELAVEHSAWEAGDTLYLMNKDFSFGGDAVGTFNLTNVEVRYEPSFDYIQCAEKLFHLVETYEETNFTEKNPIYYHVSIFNGTITLDGFSVFPLFRENDVRAMKITYLKLPPEMVATTDIPQMPATYHSFLYWRAVEEGALMRSDTALASYASQKYEHGKETMHQQYSPSIDLKVFKKVSNRYSQLKRRRV